MFYLATSSNFCFHDFCSALLYLLTCTNFFFHVWLADQGDEYELAPGKVTRSSQPGDGCCWTHGNFVACWKRSGCFSFLPVPRTLFFFEHVCRADFEGVVTCIPLGMYLLVNLVHSYLSAVTQLHTTCFCLKISFSYAIPKHMYLKEKCDFHQKACNFVDKATVKCPRFTT